MDDNTKNLIQDHIDNNEVCLFMKGTPDAPQCGFSMAVTNMLKLLEVNFQSVNVLEDENVREGIKTFKILETAIENPHCGASGVPFIKRQTSLPSISLLIKLFIS